MEIHSDQTEGENRSLRDYSDSDVLSQITNPDKGKGTILKKLGIVILSLVIFAGTGLFRFTLSELVILIIVLFVHEAGHLIAMKVFKYSNMNLLFIPFVGAVITGREQTPYASRKALVSLAGANARTPHRIVFCHFVRWDSAEAISRYRLNVRIHKCIQSVAPLSP